MDINIATPIDTIQSTDPFFPPKIFKLKSSEGQSNTYSFAEGCIYDTLGLNKVGQPVIACDSGALCALELLAAPMDYGFYDEGSGYQVGLQAFDWTAPSYEEVIIVYADGLGGQVVIAASNNFKTYLKKLAPAVCVFTKLPQQDENGVMTEEALEQGLHYLTLHWIQNKNSDGTMTQKFTITKVIPKVLNVPLGVALKHLLGLDECL